MCCPRPGRWLCSGMRWRIAGSFAVLRHDLIGRAGHAHARRQRMELLVLGIAQDQLVIGIPQHEGFGNILDRVLEAEFRFLVEAVGEFLRGDVDGDADEMRRVLARRTRQLGACPEPHPMAVGMAHAEFLIERLASRRVSSASTTSSSCASSGWMRSATSPKFRNSPFSSVPSDVVHGFRPEDRPRAMSQSHRPQWPRSSALSSRSVASVQRAVGFRRLCRLPVEGRPAS